MARAKKTQAKADAPRTYQPPEELQARQFALLLYSGVAPSEAIQLFVDVDDYKELMVLLTLWKNSKHVRAALKDLQGGAWERKTTDQMLEEALEQHYRQLAFTLNNMHYFEAAPQDRQKLDAARDALEKKRAGTAGTGDGLSEFMNAIRSQKIKPLTPKLTVETSH